jgi:hypothetical protein
VVVGDRLTVGEQLAVVVEQDDAVAEQPPALLGVAADDDRQVAYVAGGVGAGGSVVAHRDHSRSVRRGRPEIYGLYMSGHRTHRVSAREP